MRRGSVLLLLVVAACTDDQEPEQAADLLARVRAASYRDWERAPGYETRRHTDAPHADAVDIYINDVVSDALPNDLLPEWPIGSVIVKDGFDGDDLELIAVMEKRADGWFWAEYYNGESAYSGKPDICTDCHDNGDDYVMAFRLARYDR